MRHTATAFALALVLGSAAASAQDVRTTSDPKVKADNGTVVTLTGCVMIGGATSFMLTNITAERKDSDKGPSLGKASYALIERDGVELGTYINQRVQLTGVFVPAATRGDKDEKIEIKDTNKNDGKTAATEKVKVARGAANQFLVASVKAVAPTCG